MHVYIDQTRRHDKTGCVYEFGLGCLARGYRPIGDDPIGNPKVGDLVTLVRGIDDSAVGDTNYFHEERPTPPAQR
jgi:hypothetical protein